MNCYYGVTSKGFEMLYFCSIGVLNVGKLCNNEKKNGEINLCVTAIFADK